MDWIKGFGAIGTGHSRRELRKLSFFYFSFTISYRIFWAFLTTNGICCHASFQMTLGSYLIFLEGEHFDFKIIEGRKSRLNSQVAY